MNIDSDKLEKHLNKQIQRLTKQIADENDKASSPYRDTKIAELEGRMQAFKLVKAAFC